MLVASLLNLIDISFLIIAKTAVELPIIIGLPLGYILIAVHETLGANE